MISVEEAIRIVLSKSSPVSVETVDLDTAMGRVLAEDIIADTDLPPFNRAQMDGFALRSADASRVPVRLAIVGESAAGSGWHNVLQSGEAVRIMTGAPVPEGADCVQKVEVTREFDSTVEISEAPDPGQFIVVKASEVRSGERVIPRGTRLNAAMVAALAAFGYGRPRVYVQPRVSVIPTGSELVRVDETPGRDQIRDSNGFSLSAYAKLAGAIVERVPVAIDDPELLKEQIAAATKRSDMVVLSGGVSMGVYDFTKAALRQLGAEIFFERVSLRPGKPTVFARLGQTLIFGLPGNPVSVSVTFNLFARTALLAMQGDTSPLLEEVNAVLTRGLKGAAERASYLPGIFKTDAEGKLLVEPLKWGGSSDFVAFTQATALIIVPAGVGRFEDGQVVRTLKLPG
jgi:molybdopterin molybdotransferase